MYQFPGNRPRYLSLTSFKFPLNAKLSILHRITGLFLIISLLGFIALLHLILLHPSVTLASVSEHCIIKCLSSVFWISLSFHWLTGLRHILAEHFTQPTLYKSINSKAVSVALLGVWLLTSILIWRYFWVDAL